MKTRNKKYGFKRFLVGGMLALSVFSTSFLVTNFENFNRTSAVYASYQETLSSISNNNFNSYSTSTTPYSPNSWTFENPADNEKIKNGVIDASSTVFPDKKEDYELEVNPGQPAGNATENTDPLYKHLMINSYAGQGRAGYKSSTFTLDANSYYTISVSLKTEKLSQASIYLSGLSDEDVDAQITNISTYNAKGQYSSWETYTMYIETSEFSSETATLELWLGGKESNQTSEGAVFFNKVTLTKYSENTYRSNLKPVKLAGMPQSKEINLFDAVYENVDFINNSTFSDNSAAGESKLIPKWTTIESSQDENQITKVITTSNYNAEVDTNKDIANPGTNYKTNDDSVLFMYNKVSGTQGIKSNEFTIKQNEMYMISVWAKSDCGTGNGATLLVEQVNENEDDEEDFTPNKASLTTSTSITTNSTTNNWTQYKIFVEGHPLQDTKATLQIWLGTKDSPTTGYVFIDDIEVQKVSNKTYSNGSSSNSATYSYNSENNQFTIVNGNFNIATKPENELTYPLTVSNWALTTDENYNLEKNLTGTINTKSSEFTKFNEYITEEELDITVSNPGLTPIQRIDGATLDNSSNNVLMIGNITQTSQSYKCEDFTLNAESYYKISMLVNTQYTTPDSNTTGAKITLANSSFTAIETPTINTNGEWKEVNLYVHVGSNITTFNLTLALNNAQGFAFFDDVTVNESTEQAYNAQKANLEYKAELNVEKNDSFDLHNNSDTALSTPYNWTATNHSQTDSVIYGALNTTKNTNDIFTGITVPSAPTGENVLAINSNTDTHFSLSATQKIDLSIDGYYRISVKVKTLHINQENKKYDDDGNLINYGATIALNGYEKSFTAIDTERDLVDGYATYEFLIKPNADAQTYVILGLGSEDNLASGYVFFDDVVVEKLTEATYNEAVSKQTIRTLLLSEQIVENEEEETETEFSGSKFDWVVVPSLLTSLAIIIAIVGSTIRRFKFTKQPKVKTKYDRRKTVEVDLNKRERIELRNEIIKELNQEYTDIGTEIDNLVKQFEAEKAEAEKLQAEKLQAYEEIKQTIIIEREKVTREYNDKLNATETLTEEDKSKYEKEFKAYIKKLDKRSAEEAKKYNKKDNTLQVLEIKHVQKVKELTERQKYIQEEIARIEREIEEIAKQEEIMWNEYRKAKEEAKKQKLAYMAEKRKAKEEAKLAKKNNDTSEETSTNQPINDENKVTEEPSTETTEDVEIIEPNDDDKKSK